MLGEGVVENLTFGKILRSGLVDGVLGKTKMVKSEPGLLIVNGLVGGLKLCKFEEILNYGGFRKG